MLLTLRRGFTLVELLVVITIIGILAGMALPNYLRAKDKAKETECKANLHVIQAALEQYATDHPGLYPKYLIGGDQSGWYKNQAIAGRPIDEQPPFDPLIHGGYFTDYPQNPFVDDGLSTTIAWTLGDEGLAANGEGDVRFGWSGTSIGNTLDDPRFLWASEGVVSKLQYTFSPNAKVGLEDTSRNETTPFYMMGGVPNPEAPDEVLSSGWWEGQFFYRAAGDFLLRDEVSGGQNIKTVWALPITNRNRYFLGVYGSNRTKGKDVIRLVAPGNPPTIIRNNTDGALDNLNYRDNPYGQFTQVKFSPPEVMGGGDRDNMPYFPPIVPTEPTRTIYGAPDGYPDGIIHVFYTEKESSDGGSSDI